jgi:hypothetical protein
MILYAGVKCCAYIAALVRLLQMLYTLNRYYNSYYTTLVSVVFKGVGSRGVMLAALGGRYQYEFRKCQFSRVCFNLLSTFSNVFTGFCPNS